MQTFRLKFLFCTILVIAVALMWWQWATGTDLTANRILEAREKLKLKTLPTLPVVEFHGIHRPEPTSNGEAYRLLREAGIPESYAFKNIVDNVDRGIYHFDRYYVDLWMDDCRLLLAGYQVEGPSVSTDFAFHWQADWPSIEAKAHQENWIFYRQVIVSLIAVMVIGWAARPHRK